VPPVVLDEIVPSDCELGSRSLDRQSSLHQHPDAIADIRIDGILIDLAPSNMPQHGIGGNRDIPARIDQRPVKIKN
jgi:hypothetical protein